MIRVSDIFNSDFVGMTRYADKLPKPPHDAPEWAWRIYEEQKKMEERRKQVPPKEPGVIDGKYSRVCFNHPS